MNTIEGIEFCKMSGHGNDFILVDNWDGGVAPEDMPQMAQAVCRRRTGVGADGIVFVEPGPDEVDFAWRFFNADGSEGEMCGNAGRCVARFANMTGIAPTDMSFMTKVGVIRAEVRPETVIIQLTKPGEPVLDVDLDIDGTQMTFCSLNTGVPHAVTWVDNIEGVDVVNLGRTIRNHKHFQPAGTNANFVQVLPSGRLYVRTFERGVEDETLACGTGVTASVLLSHLKGLAQSPTRVLTRGGEELLVYFKKKDDGFDEIFLEGKVRVAYTGTFSSEVME